MKKIFYCLIEGIKRTIIYDGTEHAGYMAFMVMLSLFPFLVFFLALTSFFGVAELGSTLIEMLIDSSPESAVGSIKVRLEELKQAPPSSLLNLAICGTIWTASSFVEGMRTILNRIFEVTSPPAYFRRRILSIIQFLALCFILVTIMLFFGVIPALLAKLQINIKDSPGLFAQYTKDLYMFVGLFTCVLGFYRFIPNTVISTWQIIPGALLTSICWQICGRFLMQYINQYHQLSLVYGSLGSIIITMLFFYIINFIFIVGAAFNYHLSVYTHRK